ncbi:endoplasmic oxidoreductin-1 [Tilletia horrida]|nr:endoplasmic oxidoreductin-1 [Tilletia horrida]
MRSRRTRSMLRVAAVAALAAVALLAPPVSGGSGRGRGSSLSARSSLSDPSLFLGLDSVLKKGQDGQICRPTGLIDDARCDFETVEALNDEFFNGLHRLVQTPYFRFYKLDLYRDCPFWTENSFCMNRACGVEQAEEEEIPEQYRTSQLSSVSSLDAGMNELLSSSDDDSDFCFWDDTVSGDARYVDLIKNPERFTGYAGPSASRVWKSIYEENCFGLGGPFIEPPRPGELNGFVSRETLLASSLFPPAGAPGGGGSGGTSGARKDVSGISPAFRGLLSSLEAPVDKGDSETCLEKRVFYRIISGLHASISIHVCAEYLDQQTGEWAPNLECFVTRIAQHPERLQNVYFNYVLMLRALARLGDGWLDNIEIGTGTGVDANAPWNLSTALSGSGAAGPAAAAAPRHEAGKSQRPPDASPSSSLEEDPAHASDSLTREHLESLIAAAQASPPTFDEHSMFDPANPEAAQLRSEFRQRFRNISAIMDCVGCDKCRLWGKVQVNGLGTALKILFSDSVGRSAGGTSSSAAAAGMGAPGAGVGGSPKPPVLTRSELVALINTAHRFAESLRAVTIFREMYQGALRQREEEQLARTQPTSTGSSSRTSGQSASGSTHTASTASSSAAAATDNPTSVPHGHDEL